MPSEVRILVRAVDEASAVFAKTEAEAKGLTGRLSGVGGMLKGMAAGAVAFGAIDIFKHAIENAETAEQGMKLTEARIKSTGGAANVTAGDISKLGASLSDMSGVTGGTIRTGENMLLTFKGIRNEAGKGNDIFNQTSKAILDVSQSMTKGKSTSQSMQATAKQLGKALNDPIANLGSLTRLGVSFTKQQKDQIKAMAENGDKLGAQRMILAQVNKAYAGSAAAMATPMDQLKARLTRLSTTIGLQLLPVVEKFTEILIKVVTFMQNNASWLNPLLAGLAAILVLWKAWNVALEITNALIAASTIGLIVIALAALAAGLIYAYTHSETFRKIVKGALDAVSDAAKAVFNWLKKNWPLLLGILTGPMGLAAVEIIKHWDSIKNGIKAAYTWLIKNVFTPIGNFFTKTIPNAAKTLAKGVVKCWDDMKNGLKTDAKWITDKMGDVVSFFKGLPKKITNATKGMFDGIKNAFRSAINFIIRGWNNLKFTIGKISVLGKTVFPGVTVNTPNIPQLAHGGISGGGLAMVGENGPEYVQLPHGSHVRTNADSRGMANVGAGGHFTISFEKSGDTAIDALMDQMKNRVRVKYAGSAERAFGKG